jgi:hypothetical protein
MTIDTIKQSADSVILIRPHHFASNPETAGDNSFQSIDADKTPEEIAKLAYQEVTAVAQTLREEGVNVHLFEDEGTETPDSVFANTWFSTHWNGMLGIYPMAITSRRAERRTDIIDYMKANYVVQKTVDLTHFEEQSMFLEGPGTMVFDHTNRLVYATRSSRMHEDVLAEFCKISNFTPVVFDAHDENGVAIYHTNIIMSIGEDLALICTDLISNAKDKENVLHHLTNNDKNIITLSRHQIQKFAGNMIELYGHDGKILVMSTTARNSLEQEQIEIIERYSKIVTLDIPTVESAGGSVRCMLAGIYFSKNTRMMVVR